jgi:acylglycerol lipase
MIHYEESLLSEDGSQLHVYRWVPKNTNAALVISHGWSEHAGRYADLAAWFASNGFEVHALDHRGHGKSEGRRGHVRGWCEYVRDLETLRSTIDHDYQYILGHSMGGMIAMLHLLQHPGVFKAAALSGPACDLSYEIPVLKRLLAATMSSFVPALKIKSDVDPALVCGDPDVVASYSTDPLNHGVVSARWFSDYLKQINLVKDKATEIETPIAIWHGEKDALVASWVGESLYERLSCQPKQFKIVEGALHEILFEKDWKNLAQEIKAWLERN